MEVATAEARKGLAEGGIPIGAAIFDASGKLVGAGHNRRVQNGDPSLHGETDAFRNAGRQRSYRNLIMAPLWPRAGTAAGCTTIRLRHAGCRGEAAISKVVVEWLRSLGVTVIDLDSEEWRFAVARIYSHPS